MDGSAVTYDTDWLDSTTHLGGERAVHLFAMRDQVERLRKAVAPGHGFADLDEAFPELIEIVALAPTLGLAEDEVERSLVRLYRHHVQDFDALLARIDRPGWGSQATVSNLPIPAATVAAG